MINLYNVYVSAIKLQLLTFVLLIIITLLPILCNKSFQRMRKNKKTLFFLSDMLYNTTIFDAIFD